MKFIILDVLEGLVFECNGEKARKSIISFKDIDRGQNAEVERVIENGVQEMLSVKFKYLNLINNNHSKRGITEKCSKVEMKILDFVRTSKFTSGCTWNFKL